MSCRQLAVMLFCLVMLLGGSIFSVLQVGAVHGKVNRTLFVLAQLQYSIATVGLHLWQIALLDTLGAWPAQVEGQISARIRRRRHSTALSNLQTPNSPGKRRRDRLPRIAALSAIVLLSVLTPTWRLSMRLGRLEIVKSMSRVAGAVSLSFIALSLIMLARVDVGAVRRLKFARCLTMTGNLVEGGAYRGMAVCVSLCSCFGPVSCSVCFARLCWLSRGTLGQPAELICDGETASFGIMPSLLTRCRPGAVPHS